MKEEGEYYYTSGLHVTRIAQPTRATSFDEPQLQMRLAKLGETTGQRGTG